MPKSSGAAEGPSILLLSGRRRTGGHRGQSWTLLRRRGPWGGLHTRGSALPFSEARNGKKEILGLAIGEVPPARQGGPASTVRVPPGKPAKSYVSHHPRPRTTRLRGSWSSEEGLGRRGGRDGGMEGDILALGAGTKVTPQPGAPV